MTKRVVLIGHPVAHSLSGAMQQAAFDELGIDARYELWDRPPIELADAIGELRGDDFLGANVTIPHKERVVPMVDRLTEEASFTGAVNTLTREGKRLIGHNTDVAGFKVALDKLVGRQKMPRQAVAAIDEIPILCLAATQAHGVTTFRGVGELRVKESDRIAGIVTLAPRKSSVRSSPIASASSIGLRSHSS